MLEVLLNLLVLVLAGEEGGGEQQKWVWWRPVVFPMSDRANSRHLQDGPTSGQRCPSIMSVEYLRKTKIAVQQL